MNIKAREIITCEPAISCEPTVQVFFCSKFYFSVPSFIFLFQAFFLFQVLFFCSKIFFFGSKFCFCSKFFFSALSFFCSKFFFLFQVLFLCSKFLFCVLNLWATVSLRFKSCETYTCQCNLGSNLVSSFNSILAFVDTRLAKCYIRPCLHGGGITFLKRFSFEKNHLFVFFCLFPLHARRDNPGVEITLPACWDNPSRRDNVLFVLGYVNARKG